MASIFQWFDFELVSLKGVIRLDPVWIDNYVFRIHYKLTVPLLVILSAVQACREYLGDPIDCIQGDDVPSDMLDTFCWVHSTFTLPDAWDKEEGVDVPHPGVDVSKPGDKKIYHSYYQWVCFVLFAQCLLFYAPRYLWRMWEGGLMLTLVQDLNKPLMKSEERRGNQTLLVDYLRNHFNTHRNYFLKYVTAEVLNVLNVIGQIYLMDDFLDGTFSTYGPDVINFPQMEDSDRLDPMRKVFPRMTKCTFHRFGSSGDVVTYDSLCILPLNVFNEKIYVFLWFYSVVVALVSVLVVFYRVAIVCCPMSRSFVFRVMCPDLDKQSLTAVLSRSHVGDWFILNQLRKNLHSGNFRELMDALAEDFTNH